MGKKNRAEGYSTERLAAGGPPSTPPLLSAGVRESFASSSTFQLERMRCACDHCGWGFLPCSLAMLMGFMTPLLAPEDRCEEGGGGEGGEGGDDGSGVS